MANRKHSNVPPKKTKDYHGHCMVSHASEEVSALSSANYELDFHEAMRLSFSLQAALIQMNTYNRAKREGKNIRIQLSFKMADDAISLAVNEITVPTHRRD